MRNPAGPLMLFVIFSINSWKFLKWNIQTHVHMNIKSEGVKWALLIFDSNNRGHRTCIFFFNFYFSASKCNGVSLMIVKEERNSMRPQTMKINILIEFTLFEKKYYELLTDLIFLKFCFPSSSSFKWLFCSAHVSETFELSVR